MPRRSTRKRPNDHPEKTQTTLKEPTRKRAKVEPKKKKTTKKVVEEEEDEVMKVEETKVEEMKGEEMKVDSVQTDDDDDFDFDELMELVSPSKKKTTTTSRGKKKGFADSTQDDFIKMLNDMKQEEEKLNEARTSYKKNEGKDLPDTLDDSIEAELFAEDEKFVLTPPILFEKKVDAQAAYDRYNLKRVTERNDISYRTILAKHPYFVGNDTNLISLPTQEDLVASGFMQTLLRQIPVNSIPPFIFDWLFNLICFSRNSTIPGTAFRTLASLISPLPFSFEIDTLSPDLSIIDAMDGSGECKWSVSYSTFVDVLILHGANPEKFGREKEKEEEEEEDSDEEMGKEGEDGEKKKKPLFNSLRQYQLDLFLQLTGLTITASKYKKDASDLPQFLKVCAMLLLDPVGQHTQGMLKISKWKGKGKGKKREIDLQCLQLNYYYYSYYITNIFFYLGSILYTILRALGAFPKFTEEECLSICREILWFSFFLFLCLFLSLLLSLNKELSKRKTIQ